MKNCNLLLVLVLIVAFSSCRSHKNAASSVSKSEINAVTSATQKSTTTQGVLDNQSSSTAKTDVEALTAKMNVALSYGGKTLNCGGTCRMKRNDVIQLNLTYTMIITVNVGTMELTPDYILLIDRLNKRYCKTSYSNISYLSYLGIDFYTLQQAFWGEMDPVDTGNISFSYGNWTQLGNGQFPCQMSVSFYRDNASYKGVLGLSNLKATSDWNTRTEIEEGKYQQVSFDAVMNALMGLVK